MDQIDTVRLRGAALSTDETNFGQGTGVISEDVRQRAAALAASHGARFVWYVDEVMTSQPPRFWFSCKTQKESLVVPNVMRALKAENLWPLPLSRPT